MIVIRNQLVQVSSQRPCFIAAAIGLAPQVSSRALIDSGLASIRGMAMTASVMGSAFGPLPFGFSYERLYRAFFLLSFSQ